MLLATDALHFAYTDVKIQLGRGEKLVGGPLVRYGRQPILRAKLNREEAIAVNLLRCFLHATHACSRVIGHQHEVLSYRYAGNDEVWLIDPEFCAGNFLTKLFRVLLVIDESFSRCRVVPCIRHSSARTTE